MKAPEGFPKWNYSADAPNTSGKVIVARSYVALLPYRDADYSSRDHIGHGTALGSVAAGGKSEGPLATVMGVAPRAWLGNYKVFGTPGYNDASSSSAILKALDDAVADGMDVINMSLGDDFAPRLKDDMDVEAVERAVRAGVIVVVAAGTNGPGMNTISSPATAPSAIAVGATSSDRTFGTSVEAAGVGTFLALIGSGSVPAQPLSAPLTDVEALDGNGLACGSLPGGSLSGRVALILRGSCTFEAKLINAQRAGAVAAVVYATSESPAPIGMSVGTAALAAQMVSHDDGMAMKRSLSGGAEVQTTLRFTLQAVGIAANQVTDFSAIGPGVEESIKPDVMATGGDMYVATQRLNPNGDMYNVSGYTLADGTSFSAPLVAGAAALVKSARPGLAEDEYRSLLVNTAARSVRQRTGEEARVQETGAGLLDVEAALQGTATAYPVSLSFGAGGSTLDVQRSLRLKNVGKETESYSLMVRPKLGEAAPSLEKELVELAPGGTMEVGVKWTAGELSPGSYEGTLEVQGLQSGTVMKVPYWYAVTGEAAGITLLSTIDSARRGTTQQDAIYVRITDASGVALSETVPEVTTVGGGGVAGRVTSYDAEIPGLFGITVQMGLQAGTNVFQIKAGTAVLDVAISGL
jgi:hypothetical protein